ncbi:ABC transporter permease [Streptomyces chartreusis]|uniref:ABC transporter permease n=1 Tax=Streptomyces chartreusis TaxID=1969 RepID=UPI0033DD0C71
MKSFILKRLGIGVGLIFLVLTLIFLVLRTVPGDPAQVLASGGLTGEATPEAVEQMRKELGLDQPVIVQYGSYLFGVVTGDLGDSFQYHEPVTAVIMERLPNTLELVAFASIIGIGFGIVIGSVAARRGGVLDSIVAAATSLAISIPVYVLAVVFIYYMSLQLGWFPAGGFIPWSDPAGHLQSLVLPAVCLAIPLTSIIARMTRSSVLETQQQDWVRTGHSWGLSARKVFTSHILRNALTPVVTTIGLEIGLMLGSTVLIESIFAYPGMSALLVHAINARDYPIVQGVVITLATMFIVLNICVDALYGILDPRARKG